MPAFALHISSVSKEPTKGVGFLRLLFFYV